MNFETDTEAGTVRLTDSNVVVTGKDSILITMRTRGGENLRWTVKKLDNRYLQLVPARCREHRATDMVGEEAIDFVTPLGQLEFAEQVCGGQLRIRLRDVTDEPLPFQL